uniref:Uncharacterized protein n=1 Tax=Picocystis salinarum TaxID=88271 RepID=A0A7S3UCW5_9CHLO
MADRKAHGSSVRRCAFGWADVRLDVVYSLLPNLLRLLSFLAASVLSMSASICSSKSTMALAATAPAPMSTAYCHGPFDRQARARFASASLPFVRGWERRRPCRLARRNRGSSRVFLLVFSRSIRSDALISTHFGSEAASSRS